MTIALFVLGYLGVSVFVSLLWCAMCRDRDRFTPTTSATAPVTSAVIRAAASAGAVDAGNTIEDADVTVEVPSTPAPAAVCVRGRQQPERIPALAPGGAKMPHGRTSG